MSDRLVHSTSVSSRMAGLRAPALAVLAAGCPKQRIAAAFLTAAVRPSLPALLGALAVAALLFGLGLAFVTPRFMTSSVARYLAAGPNDDYAFVTADAMRVRRAGPRPLAIALFGASGLREAVSDSGALGEMIGRALGQPAAVYDLTTARSRTGRRRRFPTRSARGSTAPSCSTWCRCCWREPLRI